MQRCPRAGCCRAGDDLASCNDAAVIGCPAPVEVNFARDVVLHDKANERTYCIPAADLVNGRSRFPKGTDLSHTPDMVVLKKGA